jgi:hypothetical protein
MKALKITLIVALFLATFTSCTKQDLNEDDVLVAPTNNETFMTGGVLGNGGTIRE